MFTHRKLSNQFDIIDLDPFGSSVGGNLGNEDMGTMDRIIIMGDASGVNFFEGDFAEIIFYNYYLGEEGIEDIQDYLNKKYVVGGWIPD